MIGMVSEFKSAFEEHQFSVDIPKFSQEMEAEHLIKIIGKYDGWIIGDDPANRDVISAGASGRLKACMRWGVGVNNVDFSACKEFGIKIENTPGVFGREVADLACHYVSGLARSTFSIDRNVKEGKWFKPIGTSLWSTKALIVGFGDIGQNLAKRLLSHDMEVYFVDPFVAENDVNLSVHKVEWPKGALDMDFIIFTAPLNDQTFHMLDSTTLEYLKNGMKIINVGRGQLINERALIEGLRSKKIAAAALDVFEKEPFQLASHEQFVEFYDRLILGSHNGSNTKQAVEYVSLLTIRKLAEFLKRH